MSFFMLWQDTLHACDLSITNPVDANTLVNMVESKMVSPRQGKEAWMNMPMKMTFETRYGFTSADFGMSKRYGESVMTVIHTPSPRANHWAASSATDQYCRPGELGPQKSFIEIASVMPKKE